MADETVDITGLDKAAVLATLYNNSRPQGMGFVHYDPTPMTAEQAQEIISKGSNTDYPSNPQQTYFDYLKGRVMKVDLSSDILDAWAYDRDNGPGAAAKALKPLIEARDNPS